MALNPEKGGPSLQQGKAVRQFKHMESLHLPGQILVENLGQDQNAISQARIGTRQVIAPMVRSIL